MLIAGDLSGIQDYVLGVATEGGGQARRLRARSFFIQALAEASLVRVLRTTGWSRVHLCAAGKFVIEGPDLGSEAVQRLERERREISTWLLRKTGAQIRFSLASHPGGKNPAEDYAGLMGRLQKEKLRPWSGEAVLDGRWNPASLVLDPLDTPCAICRRARAEHEETDPDGVVRKVCQRCHENYDLGRALPSAKWLTLGSSSARFDVAGLGLDLQAGPAPMVDGDTLAVANLKEPDALPPDLPSDLLPIKRYLATHVPIGADHQPIEFKELAEKSIGDKLLGVLKADGDHMGEHFNRLIEQEGWEGLTKGARSLDKFFAGTMAMEMSSPNSRWSNIYTVFSGGDDLLLVGPWNLVLDFVGHIHKLFAREFSEDGLTFSAGIAFIKPTCPVKAAAEHAELLLHLAKEAGRDRVAAIGQVWQWAAHDEILKAGRMVARWVGDRTIERGWLHTILDLALLRLDERAPNDRDDQRRQARRWADDLVAHFDQMEQASAPEARFLPAVLRYAQMATRSRRDGEQENMEGGLSHGRSTQ
jgi:CRISPR-associated protein Csm1